MDVSQLHRGHAIHVSELKLAEGMKAVTPGNVVIAQIVSSTVGADETAPATGSEPELIRKEKAEAAT